MKIAKTSGVIDPATLTIVALLAAGALLFGGQFHLPAFLQKKPAVVQLDKTQQELAEAKAARAKAEADLAAAKAQANARKDEQLRYAQSMSEGTAEALKRVPAEHKTAEVQLATDLNARTVIAMNAAIGTLSPDQRVEILKIVDGALSRVEAERDAARAELAKKDAALAEASTVRAILEKQVPALQARLDEKEAMVADKTAKAADAVAKVRQYAVEAASEREKAGSLDAYAGTLFRILIGLGLLYGIAHVWLPNVAQSYPDNRLLNWAANTAKNFTTGHT